MVNDDSRPLTAREPDNQDLPVTHGWLLDFISYDIFSTQSRMDYS